MNRNLEEGLKRAMLVLDPDKITAHISDSNSVTLIGEEIFHNIPANFIERVWDGHGTSWRNPNYAPREHLQVEDKHRGLQIGFSYFMNYVGLEGDNHCFELFSRSGGRQESVGYKRFPYGLVKAILSIDGELVWEPEST